ncbi:MAG TPA: DUF3108 domain-containing protein [Pyrinomonadaceae bacterium]|nr:DUF3108 domain-containing protein [Pyrinomonadaceae bacterium]
MKFFRRSIFVFAIVAAALSISLAQNGGSANGLASAIVPGEELSYEGKLSKSLLRGITVADMTFTVSRPSPDSNFVVSADARSKGTLTKLFRFSFEQEIVSHFDPHDLKAYSTKKRDVQKERIRLSEAVFDYSENQVTYTETDPNQPMRPPRKIASDIKPETYDLISAIYRLRTVPLAVGSTFELTVSDSGLVYRVPVRVVGKERQKTAIGRVNCFRVEPVVFGPGRLLEGEGSMIIWITDDARRIPVRSQVNASIGKIEIRIKSAKNVGS